MRRTRAATLRLVLSIAVLLLCGYRPTLGFDNINVLRRYLGRGCLNLIGAIVFFERPPPPLLDGSCRSREPPNPQQLNTSIFDTTPAQRSATLAYRASLWPDRTVITAATIPNSASLDHVQPLDLTRRRSPAELLTTRRLLTPAFADTPGSPELPRLAIEEASRSSPLATRGLP